MPATTPSAVFVIGYPGHVSSHSVANIRAANPEVKPELITEERIRAMFRGTGRRVCSVGPCGAIEPVWSLDHHKAGTLPGMSGGGVFVLQSGKLRLLGIRT